MNDPELKAMAAVYDALEGLNAETRKRVTDWVLAKLKDNTSSPSKGAKRGRKPGTKNAKAAKTVAKATGAKRGRKPGSTKTALAAKKTGKRGRPAGSANKTVKAKAVKTGAKRRGRPAKAVATA